MSSKLDHELAPLTQDEIAVFEKRLKMARHQLADIDTEIERELADVRDRIAVLQQKREIPLKLYDAACTMLGIANDLEQEPDSDRAAS